MRQAYPLVPLVFAAVAAEVCKAHLQADTHVEVARAKAYDVRFADSSAWEDCGSRRLLGADQNNLHESERIRPCDSQLSALQVLVGK